MSKPFSDTVRDILGNVSEAVHEEAERWQKERRERDIARDLADHLARGKRMGIPTRHLELLGGEAAIDPTEPLEAIRASRKRHTTLVLSGRAGCGKTFAACYWLFQQRDGCFMTVFELSRKNRYLDKEMRALEQTPALVIDDIGAEFFDKDNRFATLLDGIVIRRHDSKLPTILTTNLQWSEFSKQYGARITDRIRGSGRFVSTNQPSLRGAP